MLPSEHLLASLRIIASNILSRYSGHLYPELIKLHAYHHVECLVNVFAPEYNIAPLIRKWTAPALNPVTPACLSPFFFMMKLDPIKMEEVTARARPLAWSDDQMLSADTSRLKDVY
jgi:hypothetical protein